MFKLFINCFRKKYCQFQGRASRKEYIAFMLFYLLLNITIDFWCSIFYRFCFGIVTIIPFVAIHVRRLHDMNLSGNWFGLVWLIKSVLRIYIDTIMVVNIFVVIIVACFALIKGNLIENKYGTIPT